MDEQVFHALRKEKAVGENLSARSIYWWYKVFTISTHWDNHGSKASLKCTNHELARVHGSPSRGFLQTAVPGGTGH